MWAWVRIPLLTNIFHFERTDYLQSAMAKTDTGALSRLAEHDKRIRLCNQMASQTVSHCTANCQMRRFFAAFRKVMEDRGIDPRASRMRIECSTT